MPTIDLTMAELQILEEQFKLSQLATAQLLAKINSQLQAQQPPPPPPAPPA